MRLLTRPWTDQEHERLKSLIAEGASVVRAAAALKRSITSVRDRARKIGCPFPSHRIARQKWADTPDNARRRF